MYVQLMGVYTQILQHLLAERISFFIVCDSFAYSQLLFSNMLHSDTLLLLCMLIRAGLILEDTLCSTFVWQPRLV